MYSRKVNPKATFRKKRNFIVETFSVQEHSTNMSSMSGIISRNTMFYCVVLQKRKY